MPPPPKRRRSEFSQNDSSPSRPSPHRPENLRMGMAHSQQQQQQQHHHPHHHQQNSPRGGPGRRQGRNNARGGSSVPQSPSNASHNSPTAMSPPANSFQSNKAAPASAQAPATPSTPTSQSTQPSAPNPARDVPESNEYLTPQRLANWNASARDAVIHAALSAQRDGNVLTLSVIFHEIIEATIDRQLGAPELGSLVRDIVAAPSSDDVDAVSTFLDTLSSLTQDKEKQARVQQMLMATDIDVSRMRSELEGDLLGSLGLVRDTFGRVAVRKATHALYRQSNYNLLREETEGYSKLMTEYFTTVNSQPPSQETVSATYQRVNALIGAFDLDIGRVLDVTLDVFANLLVKHHRFFVKFLRSSAWWPELRGLEGIEWEEPAVSPLPAWAQPNSNHWVYSDQVKDEQLRLRKQRDQAFWQRVGELGERAGVQAYFELGARRITANNRQPDHTMPAEGAPLSKQQAARKWADEWIKETGTLPPPSNDIAAQLLGFKLRFYASDARDANDFLPDNLIYLAALLIKIEFISVLDLYPHLYPLEADMPAHKVKLLAAKKEAEAKERGSVRNALTMAGALPDDTLPGPPAVTRLRDNASKSESERSTPAKSDEATDKKASLPEPADQKYQLLKSLLCIGALPQALFILGRHPWLLEVYPDLVEYLLRIGHHSVSKVYEATRPVSEEQYPIVPKGAGLRTQSRPSDFIPRRVLKWAKPDMRDAGDTIDYKFYWEDWVDNVPVCQEANDVIKLCTSLLGLLGPECGKDTVLLTKIVRIGKKSLADDDSTGNRKLWVDFSATFIAPALSYSGKNPGVINEVWDLFKNFDTATRYLIYQQWFSSTKPASLKAMFEQARIATNHDLGRVAANNTKEYGRKIAKISYASPGIVFKLTLRRLISYPNMIDALVECVRYLTLLGYDCLTWTMVNFFIRPEKGGTQDDGMLAAPWLKNIASFVGKAYQRHSYMDPTPVLQFITHQVLQPEGELYMLDVLEQMIQHMGGIRIYNSVSESTILSLCAGTIMRTHTFVTQFKDNRHQAGSSARRLTRYLKETGLAPQILLALAQHLERYVYRDDQQDTPDKVVLFNLDKLRSNLLQYLELLRTYIPVEEFDSLFPGPVEMISDFGVEPDIAFTIARASIAAKSNKSRTRKRRRPTQSQTNGDTVMGEADEMPVTNGLTVASSDLEKDASTPAGGGGDDAPADVEMKEIDDSMDQTATLGNPAIEALAEEMKTALPANFGDHPCLPFYVTFWQLSLPDVDVGGIKQQYQDLVSQLERQIRLPPTSGRGRGYNSNAPPKETDQTRKAKIEVAKLKVEQQEVILANNLTQSHLRVEMQKWFEGVPMLDARSDILHSSLLQDCFLPRSRMSLQDAQYAAAMLKFMHNSGVPGFRTIKLLDLLFNANKLACIVSMYSDDEALTFGRFINSILRELLRWHENKNNAYVQSAHGADKTLPGFGRKFDTDRRPVEHLQYDDFCKVLYKWHKALFTALKACLETGDFQQIRNSLVVLTACSGSFPKVDAMAAELKAVIEPMAHHDERGDIKTTAGSSLALFRNPEKNFQSEYKFRNVPEPPKPPPAPINGANQTASSKSATPQPQDSSSNKLKATAPVFEPKPETNGTPRADDNVQDRAVSTPPAQAPIRDRESARAASKLHDSRAVTPAQQDRDTDSQPGRSRQPDRPPERHADHAPHGRYDGRVPPSDYGRLDRSGDPMRQREASPGRRGRLLPGGRTPERIPTGADAREWPGRDTRDYDDRTMRAPPRDTRGAPVRPPGWEPRDGRDMRDRPESRGHAAPPAMEPRRMTSNSSLAHDHSSHRRDLPPHPRQGPERSDYVPSRLPPPATLSPATDGPTVNPARAALINQGEAGMPEPPRSDRDHRRERGPPMPPHRGGDERRGEDRHTDERGPSGYPNRGEPPREYYEERGPPSGHTGGRDRRDEPTSSTPTGPRNGRNEPAPSAGTAREMFQPQPHRSSRSSAQDPNYGRLNQPADPTPPSGPRSERPHPVSQPPTPTPPSGPASSAATGIHPSRLDNIQRAPPGPALQTSMPNAPSGPRGTGRGPQNTSSSPVSRGPPTGPAATERIPPRSGDRRNPLGTINNVLSQSAPAPENRSNERPPQQNPPVRGRGASRANGPVDANGGIPSPMPPPSHGNMPNSRVDGQYARSNRGENGPGRMEDPPQDENRTENRGHRDGRRSERSGRDSERSSERAERRTDERSNREGGPPRVEGEERASGHERSGREKRGGERDGSSRRDREREGGERPGRESGREPRESGRRERGSRDDGRGSGREDRRSRGGGNTDDGRKRVRDPQDQGQGHGDAKRRR
ncbi:transcription factor/nuclear export subunit protein 2-domain-containing protein [Phaeosphaeria sp. MPI-PUGE-AT-0046c]|nr:transcription factor/nuclear export subunit protein 2-domain-containing protein [Phaeosphaeria sp. MPI-PUGE-AT-0046c]